MHSSHTFDYFGHIRSELPDLVTEPPELFRLPGKRKQAKRKPGGGKGRPGSNLKAQRR